MTRFQKGIGKKAWMIAMLLAVLAAAQGAWCQEAYRFESMWPNLPQPWYFDSPRDVAVDGQGNVYVVDTLNHRIQKFTPEGGFLAKWGSGESEAQEFYFVPRSIAVDSAGNVYTASGVIYKFTSQGQLLAAWGGSHGVDRLHAIGIAVDGDDNVYVADIGFWGSDWSGSTPGSPPGVWQFTPEGRCLAKWPLNTTPDD